MSAPTRTAAKKHKKKPAYTPTGTLRKFPQRRKGETATRRSRSPLSTPTSFGTSFTDFTFAPPPNRVYFDYNIRTAPFTFTPAAYTGPQPTLVLPAPPARLTEPFKRYIRLTPDHFLSKGVPQNHYRPQQVRAAVQVVPGLPGRDIDEDPDDGIDFTQPSLSSGIDETAQEEQGTHATPEDGLQDHITPTTGEPGIPQALANNTIVRTAYHLCRALLIRFAPRNRPRAWPNSRIRSPVPPSRHGWNPRLHRLICPVLTALNLSTTDHAIQKAVVSDARTAGCPERRVSSAPGMHTRTHRFTACCGGMRQSESGKTPRSTCSTSSLTLVMAGRVARSPTVTHGRLC